MGQFIEARAAQKSTNSCHAKIVSACLGDDGSVLENRHRPKLEDNKFLGVETASPLPEYDLTGVIKSDGVIRILTGISRHQHARPWRRRAATSEIAVTEDEP